MITHKLVLQRSAPFRLIVFALVVLVITSVDFAITPQSTAQDDDLPPPQDSPALVAGLAVSDVSARTLTAIEAETQISDWKASGWTGRDIRVGVIDLHFEGLAAFEEEEEVNVIVPGELEGNPVTFENDPIPHGTDVLRIIHHIAPDAELYACSYSGFDGFNDCVSFMEQFRVRIVNHSAGMLQMQLDGNGIWTQRVEQAVDNFDILWINAAGNFANGIIQSNMLLLDDQGPWHQFTEGGFVTPSLCIPAVSDDLTGRVMLTWGDRPELLDGEQIEAADIDMEILVTAVDDCSTRIPDGELLSSQQIQGDGVLPIDWISNVNFSQDFAVYINTPTQVDDEGNQIYLGRGVPFRLMVEYVTLPDQVPTGGLLAPGDSSDILTVGAYGINDVTPYSSRGPTDANLAKPDLVAPGEIILADGRNFIGTSAATPVVAGAAALMWSADPVLERDVILRRILDESVLPDPTNRLEYGRGRLNLRDAPLRIDDGSVVNVQLPYVENFTREGQENPISQWIDEAGGWQIRTDSGEELLVGIANADRPLEVMGRADPAWLVADNLVISFDFKLEQRAQGLRMVFRYNESSGYYALVLLPGQMFVRRDDRGNSFDIVDDISREQDLRGGRGFEVPIIPDQFHRITLWTAGDEVYVYLDNTLVIRAEDQFGSSLPAGGSIFFQAMDARRQVFIDNFTVQRADDASIQFNARSLSPWQTDNPSRTEFDNVDAVDGTEYLRLQDSTLSATLDEPIRDMRMSCDFKRVQNDFTITVRESASGSLQLRYDQLAQMNIERLDGNGEVIWSAEPIENFIAGNWDHITLELVDNTLTLWRDGTEFYLGPIGGDGSMDPGSINISAGDRSILFVDNCLIVPLD